MSEHLHSACSACMGLFMDMLARSIFRYERIASHSDVHIAT